MPDGDPRALPARPRISLGTLVNRAQATNAVRSRPAAARKALPAPRTLSDLERASSLAARPPIRPPTPPSALALWITVATCACGAVHRSPSTHVLVKYAENEHSFHYKREDPTLADLPPDLPREVREKEVRIAYCEECFLVDEVR